MSSSRPPFWHLFDQRKFLPFCFLTSSIFPGHWSLLQDCSTNQQQQSSSESGVKFLDLNKIFPTTCFLRSGLEKCDAVFRTVFLFVMVAAKLMPGVQKDII